MSPHFDLDTVVRFVRGDLDEAHAIELALHLDDCPTCRARVAREEPLTRWLAALPSPETPAALADRSLAPAVDTPAIAVAAVCVTVATVAVVLANPVPDLASGLVVARATAQALAGLLAVTGTVGWIALWAAAVGSTLAARRLSESP